MKLAGRVIVVTGGSRGIGRACVLEAVAEGARVVFCSRTDGADSREVEAAAAERGGAGAAIGLGADVARASDVDRLFAAACERFGECHGVVNNAAISREGLLVSSATADWDAVIEANLTGAFLVAGAAVRGFLERRRGGALVSIGTLSQFGVAGNAAYAASKGGVWGLTRVLARQYGEAGIRSNMVISGYVPTRLAAGLSDSARRALVDGAPLRRPARAEEIASVVNFLLSDRGAGINGRAIRATGGLRAVPP